MNEHRDPVVADALRRIDVPDHGPDFWHDLEARLATTAPSGGPDTLGRTTGPDGGDTDDEGPDLVDLRDARARHLGRRTGLRWQLVAAVLVIVALLLGVGLLDGASDEESRVDVADEPGDDGRPPAPSVADPGPQEPVEGWEQWSASLADIWLDAVAAGEVDKAYGFLAPASKEAISLGEFRAVSTGLAEGAGAFTTSGVERSTFTIERTEGPQVTVVLYSGEIEREGMIETASFPVVVVAPADTGAGGVVFTLDPLIEPVPVTPAGQTLTSPLDVSVSPSAEAWVSIDGSPAQPVPVGSGPTGQVSIDVEALAGPGTHTVVLVAAEGDALTARSFTVVVP